MFTKMLLKQTIQLFICVIAVSPFSALATTPDPQEAPVTVSLISDLEEIEPGVPFRIGVRFKIPEPWHIYWKNPGDSGLPTKVTFSTPEGSYVHPLTYPIPVLFQQPGNIVGYGYDSDTLFYSEVTPPLESKERQFTVTAKIRWLNCSTVCIPGKAEKSLTLPIGQKRYSSKRDLFNEYDYPKSREELAQLFSIEQATQQPDSISYTVRWTNGKAPLAIFPFSTGVEVGSPEISEGKESTLVKVPLSKATAPTELEVLFVSKMNGRRAATSILSNITNITSTASAAATGK